MTDQFNFQHFHSTRVHRHVKYQWAPLTTNKASAINLAPFFIGTVFSFFDRVSITIKIEVGRPLNIKGQGQPCMPHWAACFRHRGKRTNVILIPYIHITPLNMKSTCIMGFDISDDSTGSDLVYFCGLAWFGLPLHATQCEHRRPNSRNVGDRTGAFASHASAFSA